MTNVACASRGASGWKVIVLTTMSHRCEDARGLVAQSDYVRTNWPSFADAAIGCPGNYKDPTYCIDGMRLKVAGNAIIAARVRPVIESLLPTASGVRQLSWVLDGGPTSTEAVVVPAPVDHSGDASHYRRHN